jgi:hypothetical protein
MSDFQISEALRQLFRTLVFDAVAEGLQKVSSLPTNAHISSYREWYKLGEFDNGLPHVSKELFGGSKDYGSLFSGFTEKFPTKELLAFCKLREFVNSCNDVRQYFHPATSADLNEFVDVSVDLFVRYLIDRYMHLYSDTKLREDRFAIIYSPLEYEYFGRKLHFDIVVPILFAKFSFDEYQLADDVSIERLMPSFQVARADVGSYGSGVHQTVQGAATHAFVMKGWTLERTEPHRYADPFDRVDVYPLDMISRLFGVLRVVTGVHTGFSQLLISPLNWATSYKADLPPITGTSARFYPAWFDNYYWLSESIPTLTQEEVKDVGILYKQLATNARSSLTLALRRVNQCYIRDDEEDLVIDATIGLEALLSDTEMELTHKLALRVAALSSLDEGLKKKPQEVFDNIKAIYRYRSAIVHGSHKASSKREITSEGKKIPVSSIALAYLRMVIRLLARHERFLDPDVVDRELLLGKLGDW